MPLPPRMRELFESTRYSYVVMVVTVWAATDNLRGRGCALVLAHNATWAAARGRRSAAPLRPPVSVAGPLSFAEPPPSARCPGATFAPSKASLSQSRDGVSV